MLIVVKRWDIKPDDEGIYTVQGRILPSGKWRDLVTNVEASSAITAYDSFTKGDTCSQYEYAIVQYGKE